MKTLLTTTTLSVFLALVSTASAGEQTHYLAGLLLERSDAYMKMAAEIPAAYSGRGPLLGISEEVHGIAHKFKQPNPERIADVIKIFEKLRAMQLANEDLIDIAAEKHDDPTLLRAIHMRRTIFRMLMITERLDWAMD